MSEAKKGRKHSKQARRNMSKAQKDKITSEEARRKNSESHRGKKNPFYGKQLSEEHRRKISEATTGEKNHNYGKKPSEETLRKMSGPNHHGWKGGLSSFPYNFGFKRTAKLIRERDGYICQWCGKKGKSVNHIDGDHQHDEPWNLINTCGSCNSREQFHRHFFKPYFYCVVKDQPPFKVLSEALGFDLIQFLG